MYTLIAENKYGERLELTHNLAYNILSILGLDPPDAQINTTRNAGFDGSTFNSSYANEKSITITLAINGVAEENRIALYKYFKPKSPIRLFYKNSTRDVYIDAYVKSVQIAFFEKKQTAQITMLCPQPYWVGVEDDIQNFSGINSLFDFPFSIDASGIPFSEILISQEKDLYNAGDVEVGCVIEIRAIGAVHYPRIYNGVTGEHLFVNQDMVAGDTITINTIRGQKSIYMLDHNNVKTNLIGKISADSTWLQLSPGDNLITIDAVTHPENMITTARLIDYYEGV